MLYIEQNIDGAICHITKKVKKVRKRDKEENHWLSKTSLVKSETSLVKFRVMHRRYSDILAANMIL